MKTSVVMVTMSIATCHEGGASGSTETARFFSATAKSTNVVVSSIVCSTQAGNDKSVQHQAACSREAGIGYHQGLRFCIGRSYNTTAVCWLPAPPHREGAILRYNDVSGCVLTIALTLCLQCSSTRSSRSSRVVKLAWTVKRSCFWAAAGQQVVCVDKEERASPPT